MVARSHHPSGPGIIAPEIAEKYGRALTTVQKQWMTSPVWPESTSRRGRWKVFDAAAVDKAVREHLLRQRPDAIGSPDDLLTVAQIAAYLGVEERTVRADISRGRISREPDDDEHGVKRWKRATVDACTEGRRRYTRSR